MKLFYSYMWHLFAHIPTLSRVFRILLKIFSPANQWHRLVMPGRHLFLIFCFIVFSLNDARPQSPVKSGTVSGSKTIKPLLVGQQVPDEFWKREHLFYINGDTVSKNLEEYRGKLLILDFWSTSCASCLFHQKEIDSFKSAHKNDMNVIMVNPVKTKDNIDRIKIFYQNHYAVKNGIEKHFESIILDDYLHRIFQFSGYPHYIWINKDGYVQTQTFRNLLDRNYVAPFIDNDV